MCVRKINRLDSNPSHSLFFFFFHALNNFNGFCVSFSARRPGRWLFSSKVGFSSWEKPVHFFQRWVEQQTLVLLDGCLRCASSYTGPSFSFILHAGLKWSRIAWATIQSGAFSPLLTASGQMWLFIYLFIF